MKKKTSEDFYTCTSAIILPDKLYVKVVNNETKEVKEETFTINDSELLSLVSDIIEFPLREWSFGMLVPDVTIKQIFDDVLKQAKSQTRTLKKSK